MFAGAPLVREIQTPTAPAWQLISPLGIDTFAGQSKALASQVQGAQANGLCVAPAPAPTPTPTRSSQQRPAIGEEMDKHQA